MSPYTFVLVNPASANGATAKRWPELRSALARVLDRWDHQFTTGPGDATRLARQAVLDGYEMIVSVGGDGTTNEVVTGLLPDETTAPGRLLRDDLILGLVRQGTGGDFARLMQLPGQVPACVEHLAGNHTRRCDLGLLDHTGSSGTPAWRAFLNIASFGLSGLVDDKVNHATKVLGGRVSFLSGLFRALAEYRPQSVRITVDGKVFYEGSMLTCAVANGQYFGGGIHFAPLAEIDDGLFDIVVQLRAGPREYLSIGDLYSGRHMKWASVIHTRGASVAVEPLGPAPVLLDVDGEQPGRLPAKFRLLRSALQIKIA